MSVHRLLSVFCAFAGVTALAGGLEMMIWPVQSPWAQGPSAALLLGATPFATLFVPGLILALFVGLPNGVAAVLAWRRSRHSETAGFLSGLLMTGWIGVEVTLIAMPVAALQMIYFCLGLATMVAAFVAQRGSG